MTFYYFLSTHAGHTQLDPSGTCSCTTYRQYISSVDLQVKYYKCSCRSIEFRVMLECSAVRTAVHSTTWDFHLHVRDGMHLELKRCYVTNSS